MVHQVGRWWMSVLAALTVSATSSGSTAQVPSFVTWSGRLTDGTGWAQSTTVNLTVAIWNAQKGGQQLWAQSYDEVVIEDGYFSVILGDAVTDAFAANAGTWIAVAVGGAPPMEPRQPVGSVPYAIRAATAAELADADAYILNQTAVDQSASLRINGSGYFGGKVGIGKVNPGPQLEVLKPLTTSGAVDVVARFGTSGTDTASGSGSAVDITVPWNDESYGGRVRLAAKRAAPNTTSTNLEVMTYTGGSGDRTRMTVTYDGNVGIGTTAPQARLDVAGDASVSGSVTAQALFGTGHFSGKLIENWFVGNTYDWEFGWDPGNSEAGSGRVFLVWGIMWVNASTGSQWVWLINVSGSTAINVVTLTSNVVGGDPALSITRPEPGKIRWVTNNNGKIKRLRFTELDM